LVVVARLPRAPEAPLPELAEHARAAVTVPSTG
jgi:hypothetical protein